MFVVRPVDTPDIPALEAFAAAASPGVHTLPRTHESIGGAVAHSMASFAAPSDSTANEASYLFALQADGGQLAGTAAMAATAGACGTFFAFRKEVLSQASRDLGISHRVHALTLCSDLTAYSQLSGFYLHQRYRQHSAGPEAALLSRARLLFAALAPQRFSDRFFASMPGMTDAHGRAPFWEALGRKFFQMDFLEAERMIEGARNRTLIVELMPHYPVYVPLLPEEAQAAIGQVHPAGELACRMLSDEGFAPDAYIDIFDGGPVLQAHRSALRSFSHAMLRRVATACGTDAELGGVLFLVAAAREERFRAVLLHCMPDEERIALPQQALRALDVTTGDNVVCVRL